MAGKVLFRDVVPYDTPSTLSALHGPASGRIELPLTVHWGPRRSIDLDDDGQRRAAYRAIVREGTSEVQEALLNEEVLRDEWRELVLPDRCRDTWEATFPGLAAQ